MIGFYTRSFLYEISPKSNRTLKVNHSFAKVPFNKTFLRQNTALYLETTPGSSIAGITPMHSFVESYLKQICFFGSIV